MHLQVGRTDEFESAEAAGVIRTIRARSDEVGLKKLLKGGLMSFQVSGW